MTNGNEVLKILLEENLSKLYGINPNEANTEQMYKAVATTINDLLKLKKKSFNSLVRQKKGKRIYYLCMEFLMGRSLKNNIYNMGIQDEIQEVLKDYGFNIEDLYQLEPDAALGNGGLGRLAACFLDGLASQNYPATGFSLRYEYGLFKQKIIDGWQTELPDVWLPGGDVWLNQRDDKTFKVRFDGYVEEQYLDGKKYYIHKDYREVTALPYDMVVSGGDSDAVATLRLWRGVNVVDFNINSFSQGDYIKAMQYANEADLIAKILYPSDNHYEGKNLRIKQQYFLVSASIQNIIADHIKYYGDIRTLPKYASIHINDTHPALCIPELMRILMDDYKIEFDEAWDMVKKCVAYTNHTILAEALEKWDEGLIQRVLPRISIILHQIDDKFHDECKCLGYTDEELKPLFIFGDGQVRMANLSVIASHHVNGVSALHSEIIKNSVFNGYYKITPEKFTNVTNGIAHRRWLNQSNPGLAKLLDEKIGHGYYKDASQLEKLLKYKDDEDTLKQLMKIKYENKCRFAEYLYKTQGIVIDPNTRFDVQVKRLHEYKRQLLNVLKIVSLLIDLEENPNIDVTPQTFIFGAKAASTYYVAKDVIKLINYISMHIQRLPQIKCKLNVVFLENYNVSGAEVLIPASDVSEQISLAGKEASGTSNMKFMINGAVTLGTLDGANVEIHDNVGDDNMFLFGMKADEVESLWYRGYFAKDWYNKNPRIKKVLDRLDYGFCGQSFGHIKKYLIDNYPVSDRYMCLADFDSYMEAYKRMDEAYQDKKSWAQKSLVNIAKAGIFSADRSIREYAQNIWHIKPIK